MKKRVYILGNPIVKTDSIPLQILPDLQKELPEIQFTHIDPTEEFAQESDKDLILIDTVIGITEVMSFTDLDYWIKSPRVTVHDFDLPVSLGLLKKLGKIKSIKIIGVPPRGDRIKITIQVAKLLKAT